MCSKAHAQGGPQGSTADILLKASLEDRLINHGAATQPNARPLLGRTGNPPRAKAEQPAKTKIRNHAHCYAPWGKKREGREEEKERQERCVP